MCDYFCNCIVHTTQSQVFVIHKPIFVYYLTNKCISVQAVWKFVIKYIVSGRATDLLVPYIVEGRSELRNPSRVNCKTHSVFGLQNTSLTERISHSWSLLVIGVCLVECTLDKTNYKIHVLKNKMISL
jgi:hypothetical protein